MIFIDYSSAVKVQQLSLNQRSTYHIVTHLQQDFVFKFKIPFASAMSSKLENLPDKLIKNCAAFLPPRDEMNPSMSSHELCVAPQRRIQIERSWRANFESPFGIGQSITLVFCFMSLTAAFVIQIMST